MQLSQDQTSVVAQFLLADYESEIATTRRVIAAVPEGQPDYAPSPKCMPALKLVIHLPTAEDMFLRGILEGTFNPDRQAAESLKTVAEVLAWYDEKIPALVEQVKKAPASVWTREIDFFGMANFTGLQVLTIMLKHSIHHRGQLSSYLRPMGGKVPDIYGPSGDDK